MEHFFNNNNNIRYTYLTSKCSRAAIIATRLEKIYSYFLRASLRDRKVVLNIIGFT